jgi:hypothetical protein
MDLADGKYRPSHHRLVEVAARDNILQLHNQVRFGLGNIAGIFCSS